MTRNADTIVITGATSGFGEAMARRFAASGASLVLIGRRKQRLDKLKRELKVPVHTIILDVCKREAVARAFDKLPKAFAAVSILINNAGLALGMEPAHRASLDDWETMVDTNIKGLMYCTSALLPRMVERKRGHIINICSTAANYPYPGGNAYGATKAFVKQFSLNLRADLHGTGVRVTNLEPGLAETEFSLVRFNGDAAKAKKIYEGMKPLSAEDVAEAAFWCASQPAHVNVNRMELMPVAQSFGPFAVHRE